MLNYVADEFISTYRMRQVEHDREQFVATLALMAEELAELQAEVEADNFDKLAAFGEALDMIYVTAQRLRNMGFDVDAGLLEVHRSNLTKTVPLSAAKVQLELARERYPDAYVEESQNYAVIRCGVTGKVIKPTTYTQKHLTNDMVA